MADTFTGTLKKGIKIGKGSEVHMDFELRQMTTADLLDTELEVSAATPMNFKAGLMTKQLVRIGTYEGPFSISLLKKLDAADFNIMLDGLNEVAKLGEEQLPSEEQS